MIIFVVGDSWSSTTAVMVPIANDNEILVVSPIAILDQLSQDDLFFRTISTTQGMMDGTCKLCIQ
ncbi:hypothetical protein GF378_02150 [Candidatus Pacearchaeota archaeon]|nr:hypothetical protein [Candidatus Pacearchaeota archaeon]